MRILFTVLGYKPAWRVGGPIISVSSLAEELVRRGHEVTVFTSNSNLDQDLEIETNRPLDVNGVEVWYFRRRDVLPTPLSRISYFGKSVGFLYTPAMRRELDRRVPGMDVVHTHLPFVYPTYAAAHAAFRHEKPLFYHQRGVFDPERLRFRSLKKKLYLRFMEMPILQQANTLVALTEAEVESYGRLGVRTPVKVVPNGIDATAYVDACDESLLVRLGVRPDHLVVLFMGRLHPIKGADRLLEAFLRIHDQHPDALLVLAGPDEFGIENTFRKSVDASGVAGSVLFPGMVTGATKYALLARANLFCLPSDAEGFSMAVLEALASATAVLLSPGCHFPEVEQAGAGRIVPNDVSALTAALDGLLRRREELREMGLRGRKLVRSRYSWSDVCEQIIAVYHEGIERHRSRPR